MTTKLSWSEIVKFFGLCLLTIVASLLARSTSAEQPANAPAPNVVRLEAFVRSDLPAAAQVETYIAELQKKTRGLEVEIHDVLKDRAQLVRLNKLSAKFGRASAVVPAFYACNAMYFGFADQATSGQFIEGLFTVDVYTRPTCSRCQAAKHFIASKLGPRWPAIRFRILEVDRDANARTKWEQLCRGAGQLPGLPTIDFGGQVQIGYVSDETSGKQLEQLIERVNREVKLAPDKKDQSRLQRIDRARTTIGSISAIALQPNIAGLATFGLLLQDQEIDDLALPGEATASDFGEGVTTRTTQPIAPDAGIDVPVFGNLRVDKLGLPVFTFAIGLVDGFNPCAMWVLVFLLSVLVNIQDRRKILAIAGTFILVSGIAYFAFMAAWLNLFLLVGIARPVQILLGLFSIFIGIVNVKDFVAFKKGISISIPESSKPGLYRRVREIVNAKYLYVAIGGAIVLAVVVNMVELLCTAGLPALYTQVLTMQQLPVWQNYLYLALYILAYMFDDTLLLTAVVLTLSHRKLQEREGQWLKLISGLVILALGLVMLFRPTWLQLGH